MTDRVHPGAIGSYGYSFEMATVEGQFSSGWVVPAETPTIAAQISPHIDDSVLDAFSIEWSETSLTVTIAPGEALVNGWLARGDPTEIEFDPSTTELLYVGYNVAAAYDDGVHEHPDDADEVIIGPESAFTRTSVKTPLWEVTTDDNGVTDAVDKRQVGSAIDVQSISAESIDSQTYLQDGEEFGAGDGEILAYQYMGVGQ